MVRIVSQETKWIIVCSTMNARGTAKIADDYMTFFQDQKIKAEIVSPGLGSGRLYGLIWELGGIYMWGANRHRNIVLVNGRISPLLKKRRCDILLVTLDMMNYGWSAFLSPKTSTREKINIMINTLLVPGSQEKAKWRTVISKKTKKDLLALDARKKLGLRAPSVIYPTGSFTGTNEGNWKARAEDEKERLEIEDSIATALWITGETKNKGFVQSTEILRDLDCIGTRMHIDILGIRSDRMKVNHEQLMGARYGIRSVFRSRLSENELIELYVSRNVALCLSEEEGFGLPFMDAILFGLPVIARRIDTYIEICELLKEEGIGLPAILWIEDRRTVGSGALTTCIEDGSQDWLLRAKGFVRLQAGRVEREVREERKRIYRDRARLLLKRSSRDLARLIEARS